MANERSQLLPVLRSETQARVLAALLLDRDREASLTELATQAGRDISGVQREVQRLVGAGILADRRVGATRLVRAGTSTLVQPLSALLLLSYGPKPLLEHALTGVEGIEAAFVYGSWAARYGGEPGAEPADVDLLVLGHPDRDLLDDRVRDVASTLHREVHAVVRSTQAWGRATDGFLRTVRSRPHVELALSPSAGRGSLGAVG